MNYLIIGASSGLGRDLVYTFAKNSHNLTLISRDERDTRALKTDIENRFKSKINIDVVDCSSSEKVNTYIKSNLESVLNSKYKFLQKGQKIPFLDDNLIVKDIEPYEICLINNTNLVVEFDIIKTIEKVDESNSLDSIINVIETQDEPEYPILSQEELRKKRLDYFLKNS